jgi:hypothetical protein
MFLSSDSELPKLCTYNGMSTVTAEEIISTTPERHKLSCHKLISVTWMSNQI